VRKLFAQLHVFAYVEEMLGSIGGIFLGRTTYEGFAAH
jgi:hypothetical protein